MDSLGCIVCATLSVQDAASDGVIVLAGLQEKCIGRQRG